MIALLLTGVLFSKACSNGKIVISGTAPTGGSGNFEYLWLSSTTGCPKLVSEAIAGANGSSLTIDSVTNTTHFVRCVKNVNCTDWLIDASKCLTVNRNECPVTPYATASEIITANVHAEATRTRIEWVNNTGYKNDYFSIEKMNETTGKFEQLEVKNTIQTAVPEHYTTFDNNPNDGDNKYRVGVIYNDGTTKYSETVKVSFSTVSTFRVFPNPADDYIDLDLKNYKDSDASISIYNSFGQQVIFKNVEKVNTSTTHIDVSTLGTGSYIIRVTSKGKRDVTKQIHIAK